MGVLWWVDEEMSSGDGKVCLYAIAVCRMRCPDDRDGRLLPIIAREIPPEPHEVLVLLLGTIGLGHAIHGEARSTTNRRGFRLLLLLFLLPLFLLSFLLLREFRLGLVAPGTCYAASGWFSHLVGVSGGRGWRWRSRRGFVAHAVRLSGDRHACVPRLVSSCHLLFFLSIVPDRSDIAEVIDCRPLVAPYW